MKKIIATDRAPGAIGPYSQAVQHDGMLFVSGQIPIDMKTGELCQGSIAEQTRCSLNNAAEIAKAAGTDLKNTVKTTVLLTDMNDFAEVNAAYAEFFPENPPARSCFTVCALPKGAKIEIEIICAL